MTIRKNWSLVGAMLGACLLFGGCTEKKPAEQPSAPKQSMIEVIAPSGSNSSFVIRTRSAEFELGPAGGVQAFLTKSGKRLSIDSALSGESSEAVQANGKEVSDFTLQGSAKVGEATGKLGATGKRIEVTGRSASTGLERTVAVEVYDDFPNIAVTSTTYKNSASSEIKLDRIATQQHWLDASLADPAAKHYQMWSFQGSSLDWGKDEILPLSATFKQQNVMAAPVNQGQGGGIPVNAFWTKEVGLAIGHLETLPLVLSMPVQAKQDQRIQTSIQIEKPGTESAKTECSGLRNRLVRLGISVQRYAEADDGHDPEAEGTRHSLGDAGRSVV